MPPLWPCRIIAYDDRSSLIKAKQRDAAGSKEMDRPVRSPEVPEEDGIRGRSSLLYQPDTAYSTM
jgi:hypothetical protein